MNKYVVSMTFEQFMRQTAAAESAVRQMEADTLKLADEAGFRVDHCVGDCIVLVPKDGVASADYAELERRMLAAHPEWASNLYRTSKKD